MTAAARDGCSLSAINFSLLFTIHYYGVLLVSILTEQEERG